VIVSVTLRSPIVKGEKTRLIVQLLDAAIVPLQVFAASRKSFDRVVTPAYGNGDEPALSVNVIGAE
jgi:hypothetical protein